ncbi:hypothetical protein [Euzebya sp.]|uniref:hypothetical protein n=1 Tax=Euzebya sp. TaxID=1971409 RepID=UPI0035133715
MEGSADIAPEQLAARATEGWWFHHLDVPAQLAARGRPDLALDVCRSLISRWGDDPRGEEGHSRAVVVDQVAALQPLDGVVDLLRRLAGGRDIPELARRRAVHHLVEGGLVEGGLVEAGPIGAGPDDLDGVAVVDVARALHTRGDHERARERLASGGTPDEREVWWWGGVDDVASQPTATLLALAAGSRWWFERSWAGRILVVRGHLDEGLRGLAGALEAMTTVPAARRGDAVVQREPSLAVELAADHLDHPTGRDAITAGMANPWHVVHRPALARVLAAGSAADPADLCDRLGRRGPDGWVAAIATAVGAGEVDIAAAHLDALVAHVIAAPAAPLVWRLAALGATDQAVAVGAAAVLSGWAARDDHDALQLLRELAAIGGPAAADALRRVADDRARLLPELDPRLRAAVDDLLGGLA